MNRRSKALALSGILVLALSIALALLTIRRWDGLMITAFLFILWAELVFFGGLIAVEAMAGSTAEALFRAGDGAVIAVYSGLSLIVSFLFLFSGSRSVVPLISIQLILLVGRIILFFVVRSVGKGVKDKNSAVLNAVGRIEGLAGRLNALAAGTEDARHSDRLNRLAEELRFTDVSTSVALDDDIEAAISALETVPQSGGGGQAKEEIDRLCRELDSLIAKRKAAVAAAKRGGI